MNEKELSRYIQELHEVADRNLEAEYQWTEGNVEEAIRLHKINIESEINFPSSYINLAKIYHSLNDKDKEIIILKKGISECDDSKSSEEMKLQLKKIR